MYPDVLDSMQSLVLGALITKYTSVYCILLQCLVLDRSVCNQDIP